MEKFLALLLILFSIRVEAQDATDYFYEIPAAPTAFSATTVTARMIDGLGFRYYWGTAGLTPTDLFYRPSEGARSSEETLDHLLTLSGVVKITVLREEYLPIDIASMTFEEKRVLTLTNLKLAREELLAMGDNKVGALTMSLGSGREIPFWNLINGPISDAINHVGQIISFRRTTGNPINQDISVLMGTAK